MSRTSRKSSAAEFRASTDAELKRLDADFLLGLYRDMVRTRALDTRIEALYKQGKLVAGCYSSRGQEGLSIGSTAALRKDDVIGPMIRNLGSMLRHGIPMTMVLRNYLGRANGPTKGREAWLPPLVSRTTGLLHDVPSAVPRTTSMFVVPPNRVYAM